MRRVGPPDVLRVCVDASSSSAAIESSFRALDDAFLRTKTRIWLGEVLQIRFDEETPIADLLADGELLFQVSKTVWKMLLKKYVDLKHSKLYIHERTSFGKTKGRYMPYPKVDSFLKICRILGLTGIDMFSPSDVVEKRDTRRVCMCIRSLSKRARSKNLNVPNLDIVTYTIAMPTGMVGGIRRTLEQSQCSSSSSSVCSPFMDSQEMYKQKSFSAHYDQRHDSCSESDEAESAFNEFEFQSPLSNTSYEATGMLNMVGQLSSEGNPVGDSISHLQSEFSLDSQDQTEGRRASMHHGETILSESMDYPHMSAIRKDNHKFRMLHQVKEGETCGPPILNLPYEELAGQRSVITKEGEEYNDSKLGDESLKNIINRFPSSDLYVYSQDSIEELTKTSSDHTQLIHRSQEAENLGSECKPFVEQSSNNIYTFMHETPDKEGKFKERSGCTEMACENIPMRKVMKIEECNNHNTLYKHANDSIDHCGVKFFNSHMPSSRFSEYTETEDSNLKNFTYGLEGKAVDGLVIAETSSLTSGDISSKYPSTRAYDHKFDVHYTDAFSHVSRQVVNPGEVEQHNNTFVTYANNNFDSFTEEEVMKTIEEQAMNTRIYEMYKIEKASGLSTSKKHHSSEEGLSRRAKSAMDLVIFDTEMPVSCFAHVTKESHFCVRSEMGIDEQLNHSSVSLEHADEDLPTDSVLLEKSDTFSNINDNLENQTVNDFESHTVQTQPVAGYCGSTSKGKAKVKFEQNNTLCEQHNDILVEIEENAGELCKEYSSNQYNVQENASCTNISEFDSEERKSSTSMRPDHTGKMAIHCLENEDMEVLVYLDTVIDVHGTDEVKDIHVSDEVKDIHVIHVEVPNHDCISETVTAYGHLDHSSMSTQSQFEDACMQVQKLLPRSTPMTVTEKEISTGVRDQALHLVDDIRTGVECKEADATKNQEKRTEEINETLVRTQNSGGKDAESVTGEVRRRGNKALRSVVGGMTLIGTLFLFLHLRGRRGRSNISRTLVPSESQKSNQEDSIQKQVETDKSDEPHAVDSLVSFQNSSQGGCGRNQVNIGKSSILYPRERLKF